MAARAQQLLARHGHTFDALRKPATDAARGARDAERGVVPLIELGEGRAGVQVVVRQQRLVVQHLRFAVDHVRHAQHVGEVELAADGRGMLVAQGSGALERWFPGVAAPTEIMRAAVDAALR